MGRISHERALWLSNNVLPHEAALRAWLMHRRFVDFDIDDVVQEAYAKLAALESTDAIRHPKSYFFRTAYSIVLNHLRRSRIVSFRALSDWDAMNIAADEPSQEQQLDDREQLHRIAEAIASLPESCRNVFILRRVEGLSQREVAKRLGLSENTVEHHMTKSIRFLMETSGRSGKRYTHPSLVLDRTCGFGNERSGNKPRD